MKASSLTISVPPFSRSRRLVLRAAGFMATSTLGASPGVTMSRDAKWIWNADTPARVPAGARISAGKSGSVARSFPSTAVALVNRSPVNCMPSPESPANRTTTRSFSTTVLLVIESPNDSARLGPRMEPFKHLLYRRLQSIRRCRLEQDGNVARVCRTMDVAAYQYGTYPRSEGVVAATRALERGRASAEEVE